MHDCLTSVQTSNLACILLRQGSLCALIEHTKGVLVNIPDIAILQPQIVVYPSTDIVIVCLQLKQHTW